MREMRGMREMREMRSMRGMRGMRSMRDYYSHIAHSSHYSHLIGDCAISYSIEAECCEINKSTDSKRAGSCTEFSGTAGDGPGTVDRSVRSIACSVIEDIHCICPGILNPIAISSHQFSTDMVGQQKGGNIHIAIIMMQETACT
jgi:hypothetical protein